MSSFYRMYSGGVTPSTFLWHIRENSYGRLVTELLLSSCGPTLRSVTLPPNVDHMRHDLSYYILTWAYTCKRGTKTSTWEWIGYHIYPCLFLNLLCLSWHTSMINLNYLSWGSTISHHLKVRILPEHILHLIKLSCAILCPIRLMLAHYSSFKNIDKWKLGPWYWGVHILENTANIGPRTTTAEPQDESTPHDCAVKLATS